MEIKKRTFILFSIFLIFFIGIIISCDIFPQGPSSPPQASVKIIDIHQPRYVDTGWGPVIVIYEISNIGAVEIEEYQALF